MKREIFDLGGETANLFPKMFILKVYAVVRASTFHIRGRGFNSHCGHMTSYVELPLSQFNLPVALSKDD